MEEDFGLEYYIEIGAISVEGIDENGEFIFVVTEEAKDLAPELWEKHNDFINESLLNLYKMGLLSVSYNENLEASFEITEEGKRVAREFGITEIDLDYNLGTDDDDTWY